MSYQSTVITGHVGGEVTVNNLDKSKVANFSVAVNERFGNTERTTWFQVAVWDALADIASQHIAKGRLVLIEGRISVNTWQNKAGETKCDLVLTAQRLRLLDGKPSADE